MGKEEVCDGRNGQQQQSGDLQELCAMSYHNHGSNRLSHITVLPVVSSSALQPAFNNSAACSYDDGAPALTHVPSVSISPPPPPQAVPTGLVPAVSQHQFNSNSNNVLHPPPLIPSAVVTHKLCHDPSSIVSPSLPAHPPPPPLLVPICRPSAGRVHYKSEAKDDSQPRVLTQPPALWHPSSFSQGPWPVPPGKMAAADNTAISSSSSSSGESSSNGKFAEFFDAGHSELCSF